MSDIILHEVMKGLCEFAETKMYKQYPDDILKSLEYLKNTSKDMKYEYQELPIFLLSTTSLVAESPLGTWNP